MTGGSRTDTGGSLQSCRGWGEHGVRAVGCGAAGGGLAPLEAAVRMGLMPGPCRETGVQITASQASLYLILQSPARTRKRPLDIRSLGGVGLTDLEWG